MQKKNNIPLKVKLISDLHLDFIDTPFEHICTIDEDSKNQTLLIAGDLCNNFFGEGDDSEGLRFLTWAGEHFKKVIYILGNHEHYRGGDIKETVECLKISYPKESNITFLENDYIYFPDEHVIIYGSTLWAGFEVESRAPVLDLVQNTMNDFRLIKNFNIKRSKQLYKAAMINMVHNFELIQQEFNNNLPTILVATHFGPFLGSIHHKYFGNVLNSYFTNNITMDNRYMRMIDTWVHGHTHECLSYMHKVWDNSKPIRVLANPRGYPNETARNGYRSNFVLEI